jgi:uncharacterized membrane protein YbhN (UPF0104 family)
MKSKRFLPLISFIAFCVALYLLYNVLSRYDPAQIAKSIFAIETSRLGLAMLFVAGSYLSITLADALAARYIGAKLPYRRVALASFVAISIGHTVGIAAASSGAIRYRFYSRWGIGAGDIARIILFCAMTAALGLAALSGLALLLGAEVATGLLSLGQPFAFSLGVLCLGLTAMYAGLGLVTRAPLAIGHWKIPLPPLKLALEQTLVGTMDFCFVAAVLYELLSPATEVGYFGVVAVYVLANIASIVSHVPGGLGVLEAVVVLMIPEASVVGALIVFRAIYFLVPFTLGVILFVAYELTNRQGKRTVSEVTSKERKRRTMWSND